MNTLPIILLVSERSGSNLLRTLLGNHPEIAAPVAPHLVHEFYPNRRFYGNLNSKENYALLVADMIRLANHPYHDWQLDDKNLQLQGRSFMDAFYEVYRMKALADGKVHFCSKGIHSFDYVDQFRASNKGFKFVHMVRDPRDHVASWMKRPIHLFTPFDAIQKWKEEQSKFIDLVQSSGLEVVSIRYEDLIEDPALEMTKVFKHLGLQADERSFETDGGKSDLDWNPYWKNLSKPIDKGNKKKYLKELSREDIEIIETIAYQEMRYFGYELETEASWELNVSSYKKIMRQRKYARSNAVVDPKEKMDLLDSKWETVKDIIQERRNGWKEYAPKVNISQESTNKLLTHPLRRRIKFFLCAILGEDTVNRLIHMRS